MRTDLELIYDWVPHGARILDLACGDGTLLGVARESAREHRSDQPADGLHAATRSRGGQHCVVR